LRDDDERIAGFAPAHQALTCAPRHHSVSRMARSTETTRFVRAAIKAGLRMQHADERSARSDGVSRLQQIKASVRKTEKRRENTL
jgi:hypothetical protein